MKEIKDKKCPVCCVTKTSAEFFKNKRDGISSYCKTCSADRKRKGNKTRKQISEEAYPSSNTKICSKCKKEKIRDDFNTRTRQGKVGLRPLCRECQKIQYKNWAVENKKQEYSSRSERCESQKRRRYPSKDKKLCSGCDTVKDREDFGARFNKGGNCKECRSIKEAEDYANNKESRKEKAIIYRSLNLERVRDYARNGFKRRRAAKAGVVSTLTTKEWNEIMKKYDNKCLRCGSNERISMDHIIPISKGGSHTSDNVQPLCVFCNSSKHNKTIDYRRSA